MTLHCWCDRGFCCGDERSFTSKSGREDLGTSTSHSGPGALLEELVLTSLLAQTTVLLACVDLCPKSVSLRLRLSGPRRGSARRIRPSLRPTVTRQRPLRVALTNLLSKPLESESSTPSGPARIPPEHLIWLSSWCPFPFLSLRPSPLPLDHDPPDPRLSPASQPSTTPQP